jgi:hypothetical protein
MTYQGIYTAGPIDFRRGEFTPGPVEPALVRVGLALGGGVLTRDWVAGSEARRQLVSALEARSASRVLGFIAEEPILRSPVGFLEFTISDHELPAMAALLRLLREAADCEFVTRYRGEVVTHRLLDWLADRLRAEWAADRALAARRV